MRGFREAAEPKDAIDVLVLLESLQIDFPVEYYRYKLQQLVPSLLPSCSRRLSSSDVSDSRLYTSYAQAMGENIPRSPPRCGSPKTGHSRPTHGSAPADRCGP